MKFSKVWVTTCIIFASIVFVKAQKNIEFIEDEVQKIENILYKKDKSATLSNEQKSDLYIILEEKYKKINSLNHTGQDKHGIYTSLVSINTEFEPKISAVLNPAQRLTYLQRIK